MTDDFKEQPEDLDPEGIIAEDVQASEEEGETSAEGRSFEHVAAAKPMAGQQVFGSAMEEGFSNESVPEHIDRVKKQLGVISTYLQGRAVERIQRDHVIKLTQKLFDYQLQDMQHVLMLSMDAQKARRFVEYLRATDGIRKQLQEQSAKAQLSVVDTMYEQRWTAFRAQYERDRKSTAAYQRGHMNKRQYDRAIHDSQELTDQHEMRLNQTVEEMITRHSELLFETLKLFATDRISRGQLSAVA